MEKVEITIVGAGVVGLAIGYELSKEFKDIFILEKNPSFGQEISSRNSEVIHAGIYYPKDSLKTKTCIEGKRLLYEFCAQKGIPHKKMGKLIVATNDEEIKELERLFLQGLENGVSDLRLLSQREIKDFEPEVKALRAIYSPSSGIIDSHSLMKNLLNEFKDRGGEIVYNTELVGIEKVKDGFLLTVVGDKERFKFFTHYLINSAGLNSDKVAEMAGLKKEEYKLKYCKGEYFRVSSKKKGRIRHLIYPVPKRESLGIHATLDLTGGLRLGPDDEYVEKIDYSVSEGKKRIFYESVRNFLPFIEMEDLSPDIAGIRPKLQGRGEDFRDFLVKEESDEGLPGLINLIGIESPGLTSSLSLAKIVRGYLTN